MNDMKFPKAFACYNKNLDIRLQSTSGGIFTGIAQNIIEEKHGVVYGAAFDDDFMVYHTRVTVIKDLQKLRGSKYPQSRIGACYKNVKLDLENHKVVLFVGTPCQIQGLKAYLNREYSELWCIDFVCHGVASPMIWKGYLKDLSRKGTIKEIVFKDKIKGWKKWHLNVKYIDNEWHQRGCVNRFMKSYLLYANIRPSCYNCRFKGLSRKSDFTISDCWGVGERDKNLNDDQGLSALIIQNRRAYELFKKIRQSLAYKEYDALELMSENWTMFYSVKEHKDRKSFFEICVKRSPEIALKKYFNPSVKEWIKYYIRRMIGKEK